MTNETIKLNYSRNGFFAEDWWPLAVVQTGRDHISWTQSSTGLRGNYPDILIRGIIEDEIFASENGPGELTVRMIYSTTCGPNTLCSEQHEKDIQHMRQLQAYLTTDFDPAVFSCSGSTSKSGPINWLTEGF